MLKALAHTCRHVVLEVDVQRCAAPRLQPCSASPNNSCHSDSSILAGPARHPNPPLPAGNAQFAPALAKHIYQSLNTLRSQ